MSTIAVLGCMWGDEAKAKIVDFLGDCADVVVRFQGGSNAGHTIHHNDKKYVFHSVPSGILYPQVNCVIGAGVVIDVLDLLKEISELQEQGIDFSGRLFIDERAGLVLPLHRQLDSGSEAVAKDHKIGTTQRGIGPAYSDYIARANIRLGDLKHPDWLNERLKNLYRYHGNNITAQQLKELQEMLSHAWHALAQYVCQTDSLIRSWYYQGRQILFEGAQGSLLDIVYGSYPYVTSSHTIAGGISIGSGIPLRMTDKIIGVYKAYCTRVGEGPMPTELHDAIGDLIRKQGNEFGSTTGRPRRCGWFDSVAAKYTAELNGIDRLAITLIDVLSGLEEVKICTGYWVDEEKLLGFPADTYTLQKATPEYLTLKGWDKDITDCKKLKSLPSACRNYLEAIQDLLEVPIELISVGKNRHQTIVIK